MESLIKLSQRQNEYSVYIHTNKTNGKKYVGITRQNPQRRWQKGCGYEGTLFGNAIKKYGWDGFEHDVILTGVSKEIACETEIALISMYGTNDRCRGYNISSGGETADALIVKTGEDHPNHQRVKMIDPKTGEIVRIFGAQSEAARIMGINRKGITKACLGKGCATYKGYIWEYADKDYKRPINPGVGNYDHSKMNKRVFMVDADGVVHEFESVKAAGKKLGMRPNTISRYITGVRNDPSGRRWCYA
jgi:hypothetical protein